MLKNEPYRWTMEKKREVKRRVEAIASLRNAINPKNTPFGAFHFHYNGTDAGMVSTQFGRSAIQPGLNYSRDVVNEFGAASDPRFNGHYSYARQETVYVLEFWPFGYPELVINNGEKENELARLAYDWMRRGSLNLVPKPFPEALANLGRQIRCRFVMSDGVHEHVRNSALALFNEWAAEQRKKREHRYVSINRCEVVEDGTSLWRIDASTANVQHNRRTDNFREFPEPLEAYLYVRELLDNNSSIGYSSDDDYRELMEALLETLLKLRKPEKAGSEKPVVSFLND